MMCRSWSGSAATLLAAPREDLDDDHAVAAAGAWAREHAWRNGQDIRLLLRIGGRLVGAEQRAGGRDGLGAVGVGEERSRVPGFSVRATTGPLRFPGDPSRAFALLRPRPNWSRLAMSSRSMLPPDPTRRRLRRFHDFEAATGLQRPLSTLHERRCRRPCKTRFRLAGSAFAGGRRTLWVALKGFRSHPSSFPGLTLTQAGRTGGATSSTWRSSPRRRSPSRSCAASTNCSPSSAQSTAWRPRCGARSGGSDRSRSSPRSRAICATNSGACRRRTTSPKRSTTC